MKRLSTILTTLALSLTITAQSSAQFVVNTCKSNVRDHRVAVVKGDKENEQTVTIEAKGAYTFGIKADGKDELKGAKIGLAKQSGSKPQYEQALSGKPEVVFNDLEPGTYRIVFIRASGTKAPK